MTELQIRILIWDLFVNNRRLRDLNMTVHEIGGIQDDAIKHAERLGYIKEEKGELK